jgi:hypothetical protein
MNIDQLEDDLRAILTARADEIPAAAATRVRTHHYQPRSHSLRPPIAVGGVTAAAATGAAVWLFALGPQTSTAFAGWTTSPTAAAPGQLSTAESNCEQRVATIPPAPAPVQGAASRGSAASLAQLRPVLTDTRGPFTWVILADNDASSYASCISGPTLTAVSAGGSSTPLSASAGQLALSSSSQTRTPDGDSYSFAEGRVGGGVTAATLVLADGTRVQATLQNGWFAAWWPTDQAVSSALVTNAGGTTTEELHSVAGGSCPQLPAGSHVSVCTSRSSGAGPGGHASGWGSGSAQSGPAQSGPAQSGPAGSTTTTPGSGG